MTEYRKELVSPAGEKYVAKSAVEANNLMYGSGYREVVDDDKVGPTPADETPATDVTDAPATPDTAAGGEVQP